MSKIGIIISREFNERVRKRSFIITTILTPLLMVALMVVPVVIMSLKKTPVKTFWVIDNSNLIAQQLKDRDNITFKPSQQPADQLRNDTQGSDGVLIIGQDIMSNPAAITLYTHQTATMDMENSIRSQIEEIIEAEKLKTYDIDNLPQIMDSIRTRLSMQVYQIDENGGEKESSGLLAMGSAYIFGFMIYMFVLLYGVMVMQGVIEEKSSRVLEVMVSSVKPYELMMGKILGIASVALVQFMIWVVLIFILGTAAIHFIAPDMQSVQNAAQMGTQLGMPAAGAINGVDAKALEVLRTATDPAFLARILGGFIIFFTGGYLLYAAMFAAIGSAVSDVADSQQLQLPGTLPLILAFIVMMDVFRDPNSQLALWFSMIPLTSPIIMMARLPYGVPVWQIIVSATLLYGSFAAMVWVAAKIYRVGIFMYGKKPSWKELIKWMQYKS